MAREMLLGVVAGGRRTVADIRSVMHFRRAQEMLRHSTTLSTDLRALQLHTASLSAGRPITEVAAAVEEWMEIRPMRFLGQCMRAGLVEFLAEAKRRRSLLAVVSDYPSGRKLRALGIDRAFDHVISAQDPGVGRFKPDPASILAGLDRCGVRPSEAVMIGDRDIDMLAARAAGVRAFRIGSRGSPEFGQAVATFADLQAALWGQPSTMEP